ncbi:hypothetical protein GCM10010309_78520 [Streptomyces violaceochromogenes]|nr:hypothetical protein GCM10010309_78520 [Streptomyces violaceochromogenes]
MRPADSQPATEAPGVEEMPVGRQGWAADQSQLLRRLAFRAVDVRLEGVGNVQVLVGTGCGAAAGPCSS